jgi:transcriptional regulator
MYLHPLHRFPDAEALQVLMAQHPLGTWVCSGGDAGGALIANELPFVLDRSRGAHGRLLGHVARANPVWRELGDGAASVVAFRGPQAYVSPGWYPGKAAHGRVVPTWDYAVVHAHGRARAVDDRVALRSLLDRLTDTFEAGQPAPWRVADAPAGFIDTLLAQIVGIEIPIERLEGRLKASQDEAPEDRAGTVRGLERSGCPSARAMSLLVAQALAGEPPTRP